jgi:CBS domain-containing protein
MKVQDVMTSPAHSCSPDASLAAAARTMCEYGCGALPVLDNAGRPAGILTDRDICRAVALGSRFASAIRVREFMTFHPSTCTPAMPIEDALELMASKKIRRLPVVDGQGRLVGIVSLSDVVATIQNAEILNSPLLRQLVAATRQSAAFRRSASSEAPN